MWCNSGLLSFDLSQVKSGKQKSHSAPTNALFMALKKPRSKGGGFKSIPFALVDRKDVFSFEWQGHVIQKSCAIFFLKKSAHLAL